MKRRTKKTNLSLPVLQRTGTCIVWKRLKHSHPAWQWTNRHSRMSMPSVLLERPWRVTWLSKLPATPLWLLSWQRSQQHCSRKRASRKSSGDANFKIRNCEAAPLACHRM